MEDKLKQSEQAREQLAKELVRTKVSLECADNTIKKQQENIAELKAENERLKAECDMYKTFYRAKHSDIKGLLLNYKQTLQEIKAIADARCNECKYGKDGISCKYGDCGEAKLHLILDLITKAESEE